MFEAIRRTYDKRLSDTNAHPDAIAAMTGMRGTLD
jgi:hypothetical protein